MIHNIAAWFTNTQRPLTLRNLRLNSVTTIEWLEARQMLSASPAPADFDVSVAAVDVPLGLDLPSDPAELVRDNTPTQIDPGATVADVDTDVDYANAKIHVSIIEGGVFDDDKHSRVILSVINEGSGPGLVEVNGSRIFFDGGTKPIARFTGGKQGNQLAITFTADATEGAVNAVLAQLSIQARRNASIGPRTISISVTADGQTAEATQVANTYSGATLDDSIKVNLPSDPADVERDGDVVQIDPAAEVVSPIVVPNVQGSDGVDNDGDGLIDAKDPGILTPSDNDELNPSGSGSYDKARIVATIVSGGDSDDNANNRIVLSVIDQGPGADLVEVQGKRIFFDGSTDPIATFKGGNNGKPLTIKFKGGTLAAVNAVLAQIGIRASKNAAVGERRIGIEVTAGDADALAYQSVNVV